jgi:hypothetical protein
MLVMAYEPPDVTWPPPELADGDPVPLRPLPEDSELLLPELVPLELLPLELLPELALPELPLPELLDLLVPEPRVPELLEAEFDALLWSWTDVACAEPGSV